MNTEEKVKIMRLGTCFKESGAFFDKVRAPAETIAWARERFKMLEREVFEGAIRVDKGRLGIPVYISRYTAQAMQLTGTPKQMGKGGTAEQAEASAVMEIAERYSLFHFKSLVKRPLLSMKELKGKVIPIEELFFSLHVQPESRAEQERIEAFLMDMPMEWVHAYSPLKAKEVWVPWSWFWPINEYNGSAAGNTFEEATVQALSEIVERHVCSLISYEKVRTPAIDPDSFKHPMAKELVEKFRRLGAVLLLRDYTMDMGIPTVGAIAWDPSTYPARSEIVYTAGTAPDPERAAIRAITEVAQLAGDFDTDGRYIESGLPKFSTFDEADYVLLERGTVSIFDLPNIGDKDLSREALNIVSALKTRGFSTYVIDVMHPGLGIPVVYAVVPGNHFRDRTMNGDIVFHMARMVSSMENIGAAEQILSHMEEEFPGRYYVAFYRAYCAESIGQYKVALALYQEALSRGPDPEELASVHCHLGLCYKEMGDIHLAIHELEQAKSLNPGLKEVYNLLGGCYYKQEEYIKAIKEFEHAIDLDPTSSIDYANIGSNLKRLGLKKAAIRWYEMALSLDPTIEWVWEHLRELEGES